MYVLGGDRQSIKMVSPQVMQSSTSTGAKPFTKQKSKSFEEKMDHFSSPASQVILGRIMALLLCESFPWISLVSIAGVLKLNFPQVSWVSPSEEERSSSCSDLHRMGTPMVNSQWASKSTRLYCPASGAKAVQPSSKGHSPITGPLIV